MKLEDEAVLVECFLEKKKKEKKTIILTEVETNYGRPDVLEIFLNREIYQKRKMETCFSEFSNEMSYAMTFLFGKNWIRFETLQDFLHIYDSRFNRLINSLLERRLVDVKDKKYIKSKPYKEILVINRVVAYEAKLFKWKEAIEQAERHLWFTSESYIVMPEKSDKTNNLIEEKCKKSGVGVVYFDNSEKFIKKLNSKKKKVINCPFIWKLNEFLIEGEKNGK